MKEEWKFYKDSRSDNIRNTRGAYWEVSNYGRVKRNGILYNPIKNQGYYTIGHILLHRIVAELFIPNPDNKPVVDHIDTNIHNNRIDNLRWVTTKENCNNILTLKKKSISMKGKLSGEKNPMYGKNAEDYMTQEAIKEKRQKQSKSTKGTKNGMYGKHHTEETKEKNT